MKNEILTHATPWINLENNLLSEEASHRRPHILLLYLYEMSKVGQSIETESR